MFRYTFQQIVIDNDSRSNILAPSIMTAELKDYKNLCKGRGSFQMSYEAEACKLSCCPTVQTLLLTIAAYCMHALSHPPVEGPPRLLL